ncbi:MAG: bifunctional DNA primase/polymerase [Chloroflexi bacterium]|nr:bifunctional DNA primase/polymerase [Chloroflexota bacterium]MBV9599361.1 bifunctional DNA primase/polymerase [Chloroflexota bacterium]
MSQNLLLQAALAHARHGRAVLPVYWSRDRRCGCGRTECASPGKHPVPALAPRGVKNATTSEVVIRAWWAYAPLANPAIATGEASGVTVLDVDGDRGGFDALDELEHEFGALPSTPRVVTGRGEHVYFQFTSVHVKNTAGKLATGLDVRCCGGYVLGAGAVHPTGRIYAWKHGLGTEPIAFAPPPAWLIGRPANPRQQLSTQARPGGKGYASAALASEERELLGTPVGQRNTRLNLAAFRLARFVATEALASGDVRQSCWTSRLASAFHNVKRRRPFRVA